MGQMKHYKYDLQPHQHGDPDDHYCLCPICGHYVDELDLEEVFQHVDEGHSASTKH